MLLWLAIHLALAPAPLQEEAPAEPPNIVFILADDLGWGDLGCFGQERIQTPNLDRMAEEGLRFTHFYAGSTVCAPSRACLMTGLHTGHARVRGNARVPLEPEDVTVAEVLRGAGYRTALVGKWGLGEPETTGVPLEQGFESFYGYLNQRHAHDYYPNYLWRDGEKEPLEGNVSEGGVASERAKYSHDLFTAEALRFLRESAKRPFFLYLAYTIPHANNERGAAEGNGMEVPDLGPYADRDWPEPQKAHAAMITRLDRDVGRVLDLLVELGIDERTLVLFSSDNGTHREGGARPDFFESSGPLRGHKRSLHDGGIRVPTIARMPGRVPAGAVCEVPLAFWDFLPTAAELAGVSAPPDLDGISFVPALEGREQPAHEHLYWEFHERGFSQALRVGDWKVVRKAPDAPLELYDLSRDPGEERDLAAEHPEQIERARALLSKARTPSEHWPAPER